MPLHLKRYQTSGHDHHITISCYERRPYFNNPHARETFERSLEKTRIKYKFEILAYVVMPEHVHLLISEPETEPLSKALQALKVSVSKQLPQTPFWYVRYHDVNIITLKKLIQKRKYIHRNPVRRGLVETPEDWPHSSYLSYQLGERRTVQIDG